MEYAAIGMVTMGAAMSCWHYYWLSIWTMLEYDLFIYFKEGDRDVIDVTR